MSGFVVAQILAILASGTTGANAVISIHISGDDDITDIKAIIKNDAIFIPINDISEKLKIVPKELAEGMIGLCKGDICVPVRLDDESDAVYDSDVLMVNAELVASTLNSEVEWIISGKILRFVPIDQVEFDTVVKVGDVIPDFVLPSVTDDKMVSLSSFRGKRILLFLWATW